MLELIYSLLDWVSLMEYEQINEPVVTTVIILYDDWERIWKHRINKRHTYVWDLHSTYYSNVNVPLHNLVQFCKRNEKLKYFENNSSYQELYQLELLITKLITNE